MRELFCLCVIFLTGCAAGTHIVDVSHDPHFAGGYEVGHIYRLRTTGFLVQPLTNGEWELWTPADESRQPSPTAIEIPAGSTIRIDRLGYLWDDNHPPIPGGPVELMLAYGTLTDASGKQWPQTVVVLPATHGGRVVEGTTVQVYPADGELLEPISNDSRP